MYGHTNPTIRSTEEGRPVGPKMFQAVRALSKEGVMASKNRLAKRVGPNGSQNYGYRIVDRTINAGLISVPDPDHDAANPHGRGAIYLTDKGKRFLAEHSDD